MGMYDTVVIDRIEEHPSLTGRSFQTKDLGKELCEYRIIDGQLYDEEGAISHHTGAITIYDFCTETSQWEEWQVRTDNGCIVALVQTEKYTIPRVEL
jgi:hypothetical protein